jgi:hypothetical protein
MAAPTDTDLGVKLVTHATAQSVEITSKGEVKILTDKDGNYSQAAVQDPTFEFSVRGKGASCPVEIKSSTGAPTGVTGKIIVTSVKESTSNDDWEEWEYSGSGYPSAT